MIMGLMISSCSPGVDPGRVGIIPKPVEMAFDDEVFHIKRSTRLIVANNELESLAAHAAELWESYLGFALGTVVDDGLAKRGSIALVLADMYDEELGGEGYTLEVGRNGVTISANAPAGLLYGVHTLYQVLSTHPTGKIPALKIRDYPRFEYRGLHLDVSRHFFPIEFIYRLVDQMVMHKLNVFHWHLVDDQGWRLEIKKYPLLAEVGGFRADMSHLHWNARPLVAPPDLPATYGGYYTQDEVRALVAYAADRNITVMPEIEMPAHVMSALAAYPELSCTGEDLGVPPGGVWPITHIYCAGNDDVFDFLEDVLLEVMELFPSPFIHIGGDEADKTEWRRCPKCQRRIREEGLKDEEELQSYFIRRIEKFLNAHGRRLIGWDEILEGGLAPNASVMSWRGEAGGIEAARMGHTVVMTPTSHCYFDYYQGDPALEPEAFGGLITLKKVYSYEPVPAALTEEEARLVLGAQANVWTEYMVVPPDAEYMIFPRLAALAEVVWSPAAHRNWGDFSRRMEAQYERYRKHGINYALSAFQVTQKAALNATDRSLLITLDTDVYEPEIRYTTDGTEPGPRSPLYTEPIRIDQTTTVKAAVFPDGRSMQQVLGRDYVLHKAFAREVSLAYPNSPYYDAHGEYSLVNGIRGTISFTDGNWKGFNGNDLVATIDLGEATTVRSISVDALQTYASWIFLPQWVSFEVSADGQHFDLLEKVKNDVDVDESERQIKVFATQKPAENVRYVRVTAKNLGVCPPGHSGEGLPAWLFVSEIRVQ